MVMCLLLHLLQYKVVHLVKRHIMKDLMMTNKIFCESLNCVVLVVVVLIGPEKQIHKQNSYQSQWGCITAT